MILAEAGDTVYLGDGIYEHLHSVNAGTEGKPIKIVGGRGAVINADPGDGHRAVQIFHSHIHLVVSILSRCHPYLTEHTWCLMSSQHLRILRPAPGVHDYSFPIHFISKTMIHWGVVSTDALWSAHHFVRTISLQYTFDESECLALPHIFPVLECINYIYSCFSLLIQWVSLYLSTL